MHHHRTRIYPDDCGFDDGCYDWTIAKDRTYLWWVSWVLNLL